jgi:hypothetical protein
MNDPRREILSQVAAGTITAEEGAARLEALESNPATAGSTAPPPAPPAGPVTRRVKLQTRLGNAEIIGDPSVAYAVAEGPHKARQDGDTMVIEQSLFDEDASFEFSRPQGRVRVRGFDVERRLVVRVNPTLPLSASVQAGNLRISGLRGPVSGDVQAGNLIIDDFRGPINLNVTAGNVTATGRLDDGASTVRCRMGEVRVVLDKSSSVRIKARSRMGDVSFEGVEDARNNEVTLGAGAGSLDCECTMGTIRIAVE